MPEPYVRGYLAEITSRPGDPWARCPYLRGSWRATEWHKGAWDARQMAHKMRMARRRQEPV